MSQIQTTIAPNQIRELRDRIGDTQTEFASRLGLNWRTIQNWEAGINSPRGAAKLLLGSLLHEYPCPTS